MLDAGALRAALQAHGRVARVVVAAVAGSSPREAGAAMQVWEGGQSGTIGGGALEWEALCRARALLSGGGGARLDRMPLGPALGQCCGGAVTLLTEVFEAMPVLTDGLFARPLPERGGADAGAEPLAVRRLLARARGAGARPAAATMLQGWLVEPVAEPLRHLWIWGAGHVGRAIVAMASPLPGVAISWVDVAADRFPAGVPSGVTARVAADPLHLVSEAPQGAEHLILTYSHALDLGLCHALLRHGFGRCGLIGSATKRARFHARLAALGHAPAAIARIDCPIGDPALGKHPQAIAIGVVAALLRQGVAAAPIQEERAG